MLTGHGAVILKLFATAFDVFMSQEVCSWIQIQ